MHIYLIDMRKLIDTSNMPVADYAYICENIIIKYNINLLSLSKIPLIEQGNKKHSK